MLSLRKFLPCSQLGGNVVSWVVGSTSSAAPQKLRLLWLYWPRGSQSSSFPTCKTHFCLFFPPASFPIEKTQRRAVVRGRGSIPLTQCLLPRCFAFCIRSLHQKKKPFCFPNEDDFDNLLAPFPLFPFPFLFYFKFR